MDRRTALKQSSLLIGAGLTLTISSSILQGCAENIDEEVWNPRFLSSNGARTIDEITQILLPDSEIPEMTKKLIPQYIDTILTEYTPKEQQDAYLAAFQKFNILSQETIDIAFLDSTQDEKLSFLKSEEVRFIESGEATYFGTVKELVYHVFFNTEVGVTQYLKFDPLPGKFSGCIPLADVNGIIYSNLNFSI